MLEIFGVAKQALRRGWVGRCWPCRVKRPRATSVQTATGMGIAYNSASVWMRRGVKGWDDFMTIPMVGQYIDWNMEHNPKPEIRGDLRPMPRAARTSWRRRARLSDSQW